jgi:NAD dependent epimerase/dehydratase family enzyme
MPAAALRLALGEMAGTVLGGARVLPARLQAAGFRYHQPTLASALVHLLGVEAEAGSAGAPLSERDARP